nr:MAG TPA: hypothetical protein [Caudoviricetes sp.]
MIDLVIHFYQKSIGIKRKVIQGIDYSLSYK